MQTGKLETFGDRLRDLGVTATTVAPAGLGDAISTAASDPAVASRSLAKDAWLSDTGITVDPTPKEVWEAHTGVTRAAFGIAPYGSVYLPHDSEGSELISLFVDNHIVVLDEDQILPDMATAVDRMESGAREWQESGIIATGPSATADMGELVKGAHGPADVTVVIVTEGDR